ncbi:MAG: type VI secretion system membrane subunit TssM, partial [Pseudomonadota bacterium]
MNPLSYFYTIRAYVSAYTGFLGKRFVSLIWVAVICLLIWFYGSLLSLGDFRPFESAQNRLIAIAIIIALWLVYVIVTAVRSRRADKKMMDDLADGGELSPEAEAKAEVKVLRDRLREAMSLMRKVVGRRFGYVYELPWYLVVGAPGAGKTTVLRNSGLKFPIGDAMVAEPVEGIGGTRNCNWWFAEEAILIDTAGRYTTQGDFKGTDKAGWLGFLDLLRKHRRAQPVNGVIVTISVGDILTQPPDERLKEMRAVRQRLAETEEKLKARIPVYVLVTKIDLLPGFSEFFDSLTRSDREQVWGMTFELAKKAEPSDGALPEIFGQEFDLLLERANKLLLQRLQQEPDLAARGLVFRFPAEMASLKESLAEVVAELTASSKLVDPPLLRGVYFTSGIQESARARSPARARAARTGLGRAVGALSVHRSFFLTKLFSGVLFEEAALVTRDKRLTRGRRILRRVTVATVAALMVGATTVWGIAYKQNIDALDAARAATEDYERLAGGIPVTDVADADFLRVLPALDALAGAREAIDRGVVTASLGFGTGSLVARQHDAAYRRALNALLLPRLLVYAQRVMADPAAPPDRLFDALKLYAMLGNA